MEWSPLLVVLTLGPTDPYYNFEKWIVQLLLNKYFVLVFIAYFVLLLCFFLLLFFIQSKTLIPANPWLCRASRRRTNIEPKRIHPHKMDISLLKTWFFSTSTKDQKVQRRYAWKFSTRNEKGFFFSTNKWNTYHKFPLTALALDFVESSRTRKRETGFQV